MRWRSLAVGLAALVALAGCARDDVEAAVRSHYAGAEVDGVRVTELTDDTAGVLVDRPGERPWGEYVHLRREGGAWIVIAVDTAT